MAWFQTSFTNHQVLGESVGSSNHRKGYKVGSLNKITDPDKSDTPLLQDSACLSPDKAKDNFDWFENHSSVAPKKQNGLGKTSFLTSSFFDKCSINSKPKPQAGFHETTQNAAGQASKLKENSKLLSGGKSKNLQCEDDDESDDDWCIFPASGGYQKVKSGAD